MNNNGSEDRLKECEETIEQLKEENRHLRRAAASFGQLAERLNDALIRERRLPESDRRREPRPGGDRRQACQP